MCKVVFTYCMVCSMLRGDPLVGGRFKNTANLTKAHHLWTYNTSSIWDIPQAVDWTGTLAVSPVIHHGNCGSCYAAAGKDALESAYFRESGVSTSISLQVLYS